MHKQTNNETTVGQKDYRQDITDVQYWKDSILRCKLKEPVM